MQYQWQAKVKSEIPGHYTPGKLFNYQMPSGGKHPDVKACEPYYEIIPEMKGYEYPPRDNKAVYDSLIAHAESTGVNNGA